MGMQHQRRLLWCIHTMRTHYLAVIFKREWQKLLTWGKSELSLNVGVQFVYTNSACPINPSHTPHYQFEISFFFLSWQSLHALFRWKTLPENLVTSGESSVSWITGELKYIGSKLWMEHWRRYRKRIDLHKKLYRKSNRLR